MPRTLRLAALLLLGLAPSLAAAPAAAHREAAAAPLVLEAEIALPGSAGRLDRIALDPSRHRLLVAETENNTVAVLDLESRALVGRLTGLAEPQGVAYAARADRYIVSNRRDGTVHLYRADDLDFATMVQLSGEADAIRIDGGGAVLVGYGAGGLATIDPAAGRQTGAIALPAHPEGFHLDDESGRLYVNLPEAGQIAILDRAAGRQIAAWPTGGRHGNFPIALDLEAGVAAVAFREPASIALLALADGAERARLDACEDADDLFFDGKRHRLYVSCGEGVVQVFAADGKGGRELARIRTARGARTALFVPELDRLFVAVPARLFGGDAAIQVYRPLP